jgi:hypothetical protein
VNKNSYKLLEEWQNISITLRKILNDPIPKNNFEVLLLQTRITYMGHRIIKGSKS